MTQDEGQRRNEDTMPIGGRRDGSICETIRCALHVGGKGRQQRQQL